ncbi:MobF family relaxase [Kitasatospora sp. NPDC087861]|uniref:MobF family relaxase n=1 Tax=Kitasatospora sp. NPDC087861 TaxID=3364070 RepID=UPI0038216817
MTLHAISAGSGIDYLMRTVASGDDKIKGRDLAEYWSSGGDTPGVWIGAQAAALGLAGMVTQEAADAIFKAGVNPLTAKALGRKWPTYPTADETYERLLEREPNATEARKVELREKADKLGERTARAGWESVFSPVKSWSVLWGVSGDGLRAELEAAEAAAFARVWARLETAASWTRIGPQGVAQVEASGLIAAAFIHRTSRAGDPDFHRHVAVSAKVQTEDGRWLALDARPLHRVTVALSEMYTTELEREMWRRFRITAAPREDSIRPGKRPIREYLGVSGSMVSLFSQRRRQTEKALEKLLAAFQEREGRAPSRAEQYALAQAAALTARPDKMPGSVGDERRRWRERLWRAGVFMPSTLVAAAQQATTTALTEPQDLPALADVAAAILDVLEHDRESWTRDNATAEAYRQLTAAGWHLAAGEQFDTVLSDVVDHVLHPDQCELITPPEPLTIPSRYLRLDGSPIFSQVRASRYTSHRIKGWENDLVEAKAQPAVVQQLTAEQIDAALALADAERGFQPTEEQRAAVHAVFTRARRLQDISGYAGTGKTTIMKLIKEVADQHGIPVLGLAGGQVQADTLAEAAGIRTENIARWLTLSKLLGERTTFKNAAEIQAKLRWTLRPDTIVIVDEAGQASTPDLHAILHQVEEAGGRMLPVGDSRQLGSPGVGGAFALLEDETTIYLTEVRRFRNAGGDLREWEIDAANAVSRGDAETSWQAYSSRGRVHVGTLAEMLDEAYRRWQADVADGLASVLIAPTNALAAELSDRARADRIAAGTVDDTHTLPLSDGNQAGRGDQVVTRVNNRDLTCEDTRQWVRNGDIWTVIEIRGGALLVEHTITRGRTLLPADYATSAVELGYAITKDRVQGVTVKTGHGLFTIGMDRNSAYPTLTRGALENHAYIATDQGIIPESGEPGRPLTGHQAWAAIVARDGTQLSATARQRKAFDESESVRTNAPRLWFVLDELADEEAKAAIIALIGPTIGGLIVAASAWPALRAQLTRLADEGLDTDALVRAADASREWDNKVQDHAAAMHARVRWLLEDEDGNPIPGAAEQYALPEGAPRPTSAATYEEDAQATGADFFAAYGLRLPTPEAEDRDDRHDYVDELVGAIRARVDHLAQQAQQDAREGEGWAAAYGPEPVGSVAEAVAWRDRIAAAAQFRDLANYAGADPVGPAPTEDEPHLRGLWRAAQQADDAIQAYSRALQLAAEGATWLDAFGTPPAPGDPTRAAWAAAVHAADTYRRLWEIGHESAAIGPEPTEPVQRADHRAAQAAQATYQLLREIPALAEADAETLAVVIAQGNQSAPVAQAAADAIAQYDAARRAETAAIQAAEDAVNRAAEAHAQTGDKEVPPARLAELDREADRAQAAALHATSAVETASHQVDATAPGAIEAREQMRRAEQARRVLARRTLTPRPDDGPGLTPGPSPFDARRHGRLTDRELVGAAQRAVALAVEIDSTAPKAEANRAHAAVAVQAAAELREHAAELRAEYATRAVMAPETRAQEDADRLAARQRSAQARLLGAHQDTTGPEALHTERGRTRTAPTPENAPKRPTENAKTSAPVTDRRTRPETEAKAKAPRNRAEAKLLNAYGDTTGPEALDSCRSRTAPKPRPEKAQPKAVQPEAAPKKAAPKTRPNASKRLDAAYSHGEAPSKKATPKGRRMPGEDPSRRRPPPRDPGAPRI